MMSKRKKGIRNWVAYNKSLEKRGSINIWFDEKAIEEWPSLVRTGTRGRPSLYSDAAIKC